MSIQTVSTAFRSSTPQWKYDVFLSFRGDDTRKAFTDNLYTALDHEGIRTFKDDPELQKGEVIAPTLFAAIEESRFAIIVLSQNYATSTWCLDELVKILECMKASGGRVLPIFYDVDPSSVRNQTESFIKAFADHEQRFRDDKEKVQRWRSALTEVANFSGWNTKDWYERKLIRDIVEVILKKLQPASFSYAKNLVGMDSRMQPVLSHLGMGVDDVRLIGIWGMGGIGKTTMAREVYERISREFEVSFLLTDVRDTVEKGGLLDLQKRLLSGTTRAKKADHIFDLHEGATVLKKRLSHRKVLLVLDDVNKSDQLQYLAGNPDWFGSRSRVLITSRNERLLIEHGVERRLKLEELNDDDSLQLFSWNAFKKGYPKEDFLGLSKSVIKFAKGLPLVLEVLGSFLHGRDLSEWNSALGKLGRVCNLEIFDILKISYNDLDAEEKKIFLDIACFFNGQEKNRVTEILTSFDISATIGIKVLMERSLLTFSNGRLWMHDLLREMGHEIVRLESPNEPGRRSRLWLFDDVKHVLSHNTGTEAIEGIFVDSTESDVEVDVTPKSFSMMHKLRYLKIKNEGKFYGAGGHVMPLKPHHTHHPLLVPTTPSSQSTPHNPLLHAMADCTIDKSMNENQPKEIEYLPNSLRILNWTRYPSTSLPAHFNPQKLFELTLCQSCIKHVRIGMEPLYNLKTINLSHSLNLVNTPNFRGIPYLEFLILEGCIRLYKVDPGIGVLERLTVLNVKDCKNLVHFASSVNGLKSLKVLNLSGCSKVNKLPNDMGNMESLEELYLNGIGIRELPTSSKMLKRLSLLNMEDCKNLVCLPSSVGDLNSLKELNLSGCSKLEKLPDELGHVACLEKLDVSGSGISDVPSSVGHLKNLKELSLAGCKGKSLQSWNMMFNPFQLLRKKSHIPAGLSLHCLSGFHSLTDLNLSDCNLSEEAMPRDIGCLTSLRMLDLSRNQFIRLPESIGQLSRLYYLNLGGCRKLQILPEFSSHIGIGGNDCISLDTLTTQSGQCKPLLQGYFVNCFKMVENESCKSIAFPLLTRYIESKAFSEHGRTFYFVGPGKEVPEWYNHQSVGSSITVELHPGWFTEKFLGFAFCVVFRFLQPLHHLVNCKVVCKFSANGHFGTYHNLYFNEEWGQPVSFHTWFCFIPHDYFNGSFEWWDIYYQLEFSFLACRIGGKSNEIDVQVNKCGVCVVYEDDVKELWQTFSKQSNTKRGLQLSDCNDAASSSESQAHPKRFKLHLEGA